MSGGDLSLNNNINMDGDQLSLDPSDAVTYSDDSPSQQSLSPEEQFKGSQSGSSHETRSNTEMHSSGCVANNSYQVACINRCGKVIDCGALEDHIVNECPLTVVDCKFRHVGCEVRLPRKDMSIHVGHAVVYHLSKQTTAYEERLRLLEADNERLALKCKRLEAKHEELEHHISMLSYTFKELPKDINQREMDCYVNIDSSRTSHSQSHYDIRSPCLFTFEPESTANLTSVATECRSSTLANITMTNFEQHKRNDDNWISQPFYTHTQGYKMCLRVTANGQDSGKGTHIAVAVYLMKGEFDDQLEWPFRGDITIQLVSQQGDVGHYTRTIYEAQGERGRANNGEKFISAWGISKFKAHSELHPNYVKCDSLNFCVCTLLKHWQSASIVETEV